MGTVILGAGIYFGSKYMDTVERLFDDAASGFFVILILLLLGLMVYRVLSN
ncbi:hypothetical protein [Phaeodactylibacter xiamenensis]|uniref:hypothetical protein n=1 Tax=Phaeodactylibacter xiamenensis TaxID=1524460 RepID=UPI0013627DA3|nr:hypothetical protein [Phaeodactylibacter xiamenensis]MCR9052490.1 hypothetical protein [bacterium]MCR9101293.1 hypothetical protein [bacterium]